MADMVNMEDMTNAAETAVAEEAEEKAVKSEVRTSVSPLEGEGLRGDGTAKWYVVHTYSGYENKVKTSIERMV